jgi:serine protease Do
MVGGFFHLAAEDLEATETDPYAYFAPACGLNHMLPRNRIRGGRAAGNGRLLTGHCCWLHRRRNLNVVLEFAHVRGWSWQPFEADMLSADVVPKTLSLILIRPVINRTRLATLAAFLIFAFFGQGSHKVGAAAIHTGSETTPPGFADIVTRVKPAVIAVTVKVESDAKLKAADEPDGPSPSTPFNENSPLHHYFFGGREQQPRSPHAREIEMALGSGFFISADGYAITNDHVVQHGVSFMIATEDGTAYKARVVGADLRTDLALLKVDGRNDFPYVNLADHEPRIGDWVIAVGNPYGLGGTVTAGIVSALGRRLDTDSYDDFIQLDAPINKGNSGGPSFDVHGDVVGVNTAIFSPSGGSVGIGFAIPCTTVKPVIEQLKQKGVVTRGALGVEIEPVTPELAHALGLKRAAGALVANSQPGGPAASAGIAPGDVIVQVDNRPIANGAHLASRIGAMAPGSSATIGIIRDGRERTVSVKLGELPVTPFKAPAEPPSRQPSNLGLAIAPASSVSGAGDQGVAIVDIDPNGLAAETGLSVGDVILDIANKPVHSTTDVHNAIAQAEKVGKKDALLLIKTKEGRTKFAALPLPTQQPSLWARIQSWIHSL